MIKELIVKKSTKINAFPLRIWDPITYPGNNKKDMFKLSLKGLKNYCKNKKLFIL